jgi:hypothetical protein
MKHPQAAMEDVFKFVLGVHDISGTVIEGLIQQKTNSKTPEVYKPRVGKVNANIGRFSPEQIENIKAEAGSIIH